jgi:hypothetical protein
MLKDIFAVIGGLACFGLFIMLLAILANKLGKIAKDQ